MRRAPAATGPAQAGVKPLFRGPQPPWGKGDQAKTAEHPPLNEGDAVARKTDETDRLIEGNLNRAYAALPKGRELQEFCRLRDRLCAAVAR